MRVLDKVLNRNIVINLEIKEANNDFIDKFMANFFIFAGIWKSASNHEPNTVIAVVNLVILVTSFLSISYMFVLKYDDIDTNTEILLHFVEIFHSICAQLMLILKQKQVARLTQAFNIKLDEMNLPIKNKERCINILRKERDSFHKVMRLACTAIAFIYMTIIVDSNPFQVKKLLYASWFPFVTDVDHLWNYYLAVLFQVVIYVELLYIDLAVAGLWYGTINTVSGMLDILALSFQMLCKEHEIATVHNQNHFSVETQKGMSNCIDLHIFLKGLVKDLNLSVGMIFLEVVLTSQVAICFCGFHVIQAVYTREYTRLAKYTIGIGVFTLMLFVYCTSGQKLKNKSNEFYNSLYCCEWYQQSKTFKKSFYCVQTIAKKPLIIHGSHIAQANLHTFMNSMKAVFSFLNFLLAMRDKT